MQLYARPCRAETDLPILASFISACAADPAAASYFYVGDFWWGLYQNTLFNPATSIYLWEDGAGELAAFAWLDAPTFPVIQVHPRLQADAALAARLLDWAEDYVRQHGAAGAGGADAGQQPEMWTRVFDADQSALGRLIKARFRRDDYHYLSLRRSLAAEPPAPALPAGASIRPVGGPEEWAARVDLHREVWHPSRVTLDAYQKLRQAPGYAPDLDLVLVAPDGALAAYCIIWPDWAAGSAEFEPVGTRPAYQGQGLGKALLLEGLRRLRAAGLHTAVVMAVGSNLASQRLYASVGFQECDREYLYGRKLNFDLTP